MTQALSWTERARVFLETAPPPTDETDKTRVSGVLSVRPPAVSEKTGVAISLAATEEACFINRRDRLLRWGWTVADAEDLAHRLTLRDRGDDHRVNCTDCGHCQFGRCNHHHRAGLNGPAIGRDWVALLQHCPGHKEIAE